MTDNLLKSMLNDIWSAFDTLASIEFPVTVDHSFTIKGMMFLIVSIALIIPFISLIMGKE